jgi:membrane-bound ClpP family serine protease
MWYDRSSVTMMIFFGASMALIGIGLYMMEHRTVGFVIMIIGIAAAVIGFTVLKIHLMLDHKRPPKKG